MTSRLHPTAGELVAATHGRSLWTLDVTPLRQTTRAIAQAKVHLYKPVVAISWRSAPSHGGTSRRFEGQNPPAGVMIDYALAQKAEKLSLKIVDVTGSLVSELRATPEPGLHRVAWNLSRASGQRGGFGLGLGQGGGGGGGGRARGAGSAGGGSGTTPARTPAGAGGSPSATPAAAAPAGRFGGFGRAASVTPGLYRVVLTVDGKEYSETVRVEPDPSAPIVEIAADDDEMTADEEEFEPMNEEGEEEEGPDKPFDPSVRN